MIATKLIRTDYSKGGNPSSSDLAQDFAEYFQPLAAMQNANSLAGGVVAGLAVTGTLGGNTLQVDSGVGIDAQGRLLALVDGQDGADIGTNPWARPPQHKLVAVPLTLPMPTAPSADYYLTLEYSLYHSGPDWLGDYTEIPWVRLQAVTGFDATKSALILATVTVDSAGQITALQGQARKTTTSQFGQLNILRTAQNGSGIQELAAGKIQPGQQGGLDITVPAATDTIRLGKEGGGHFAGLDVQSDTVSIHGTLSVGSNVGIGTTTPEAKLQILNTAQGADGNTLILGPTDGANLRLGYDTEYSWIQSHGGKPLKINPIGNNVEVGNALYIANGGKVGIGTTNPRTPLDTGTGVMSGAANDYQKAQFTLCGGGTVTWGGTGKRLNWTKRFIAISMEQGKSFAQGLVNIVKPTTDIPAANVYNGQPRSVNGEGVMLNDWEALYAVHTVGGDAAIRSFQICHYSVAFYAPSNWILVAVVNGDDNTVKLGTGAIISANSSSAYGNSLPSGVILMWSGTQIPTGWALCDGQNGTPDLRSRFIVGAGADYAPNQFGEPDVHAHTIAMPNTPLTTNAAGAHNHAPPPQWYDRRALEDADATGLAKFNAIDRGGFNVSAVRTSTDGNHSHNVAVNIAAFNSGSVSGTNRPKWYALCFIMKL